MKKFIAVLILFIASSGYALTVNISGEITEVFNSTPSGDVFGGAITVGDTFTGYYTYDFTPDMEDHRTNISDYLFSSGNNGVYININGIEFRSDLANLSFLVEIANNYNLTIPHPQTDFFLWHSYNNVLVSGIDINTISWTMSDYSGTALSNTELPTTALNLSDFPDGAGYNFDITFNNFSDGIRGKVTFTEIAPVVPEPLSIVLLSISTVLFWLRKRLIKK